MPANNTAVAADLPGLEAQLQELLYDQHQDARDSRRIKQVMAQRAKVIDGLSDQIDTIRSAMPEVAHGPDL